MNFLRNISSSNQQTGSTSPNQSSRSPSPLPRARLSSCTDSENSLLVDFPTRPCRFSYQASSSSQTLAPSATARKVHFSDTSNTLLLTCEERLSNLHKQWYEKSDYKTFRRTLKEDVREARNSMVRRSSPDLVTMFDDSVRELGLIRSRASSVGQAAEMESDQDFITGIERFVCGRKLMQVETNRRQHKEAVLEAHSRQADPQALRRASEEFSEWSLELALSLARLEDED